MKPANHHIPFLDYFRGAAILSVFLFHSLSISFGTDALPWSGWFRGGAVTPAFYALFPVAFGFVGVPIFFVISGFCIHLSHLRLRGESFGTFFVRRFFRIYPPYFLALCFFTVVFYPSSLGWEAYRMAFVHFGWNAREFVSHLFLIHNFSNGYFFGNINPSFWSIAIEAQLYLLYPVLLGLAARVGWRGALGVTALIELGLRGAAGVVVLLHPDAELPRLLTSTPLCFWFSWAIGAALAEAYVKDESLPFRGRWGWLCGASAVGCYFFQPLESLIFPLAALATVYAMAYGLGRDNPAVTLFSRGNIAAQHLRWAGVVSYSAYLIHQPFLRRVPAITGYFFHQPLPHLAMFGFCLLAWVPIFTLSYFCYRRVELPSIAWGKRLIKASGRGPAAQPAPLPERAMPEPVRVIASRRKIPFADKTHA